MIDLILQAIGLFILTGLVMFTVTLILFILVMKAKKYRDKKWLIILYPIGAIGWILDILFDLIYGNTLFLFQGTGYQRFWITKNFHHLTFTQRLKRILQFQTNISEDSKRYKLAQAICKNLLDPFDAGHCS